MTVDRLRGAFRGDRVDADRLIRRAGALTRFVDAASDHVPAPDLDPARAVVDQVGGRLAVSREHTVVALAGATGSGKSSLFNALAGAPLSRVGVRRPTTGTAHARTWGDQAAGALLDWLDVPADRRFRAAPDDDPRLSDLVLLDLPDVDSVDAGHRIESDRLLGLVDLIIWVTDPQKYADRVSHERYLTAFHRYPDTVVVLNQADRLPAADLRRCLADLTRLLTDDGFGTAGVLAASTVADPPGVARVQEALRTAVADRAAMLRRLSADLDAAVAASRSLVGPAVAGEPIGRRTRATVTAALADSAGVPAVTDATERAYRFRARASMGWPLTRWIRRVRRDPLARLRLGTPRPDAADVSSLPPTGRAALAVADLAIRTLTDTAAHGLPEPWPTATRAAARSRQDTLVDALDRAVVGTDLGLNRKPHWWRLIGALQWALTGLAVVGGLWLLARIVLIALGLAALDLPGARIGGIGHVPYPTLALAGGVLLGMLIAVAVRPVVTLGARRARHRARARLDSAVGEVTDAYILEPIRGVLADYTAARQALDDAE